MSHYQPMCMNLPFFLSSFKPYLIFSTLPTRWAQIKVLKEIGMWVAEGK